MVRKMMLLVVLIGLTGCNESRPAWHSDFKAQYRAASSSDARLAVCKQFGTQFSVKVSEVRMLIDETN